MARHRSPRGRHGRQGSARGVSPARRRSLAIGLVALATSAIAVTSAAIFSETGEVGPSAPVGALQSNFEPVAPAPAVEQQAASAKSLSRSKKLAEQATKPRTDSPQSVTRLAQANCTKRIGDGASLQQALASAGPGDRICASGNMGASRLQVSRSGTPAAPIMVIGDGRTAVKGITVKASNVVVDGFSSVGPAAPGIEMTGNNITVQNSSVSRPTGGDHDGLRFFGDNLKILNNTISDVSPGGTGAHADCMQTFQSDTPSSKNVIISGNRCERVANMCLMAEGPGDLGDGGEGQGVSSNWTFSNNYCDTNASQALMIEAVQNVTVTGNQVVGKVAKAFAFDVGSTGAKVSGNKIASGIGYEVGMDSTSRSGYQGPAVGGGP